MYVSKNERKNALNNSHVFFYCFRGWEYANNRETRKVKYKEEKRAPRSEMLKNGGKFKYKKYENQRRGSVG